MQVKFITEQFVSELFLNEAVLFHLICINDALENEAVPLQDRLLTQRSIEKY